MRAMAQNVAEVLALNDGELIGKTRLQKTFYFLEALGLGYGFDFEYYHYGPYSDELAIATDDAIALSYVKFDWRSGQRLQPYAVFEAVEVASEKDRNRELDEPRREVLKLLGSYDAVSLELAATADFLRRSGYKDPWAETKLRKPAKSTPERVRKAKSLLDSLLPAA